MARLEKCDDADADAECDAETDADPALTLGALLIDMLTETAYERLTELDADIDELDGSLAALRLLMALHDGSIVVVGTELVDGGVALSALTQKDNSLEFDVEIDADAETEPIRELLGSAAPLTEALCERLADVLTDEEIDDAHELSVVTVVVGAVVPRLDRTDDQTDDACSDEAAAEVADEFACEIPALFGSAAALALLDALDDGSTVVVVVAATEAVAAVAVDGGLEPLALAQKELTFEFHTEIEAEAELLADLLGSPAPPPALLAEPLADELAELDCELLGTTVVVVVGGEPSALIQFEIMYEFHKETEADPDADAEADDDPLAGSSCALIDALRDSLFDELTPLESRLAGARVVVVGGGEPSALVQFDHTSEFHTDAEVDCDADADEEAEPLLGSICALTERLADSLADERIELYCELLGTKLALSLTGGVPKLDQYERYSESQID